MSDGDEVFDTMLSLGLGSGSDNGKKMEPSSPLPPPPPPPPGDGGPTPKADAFNNIDGLSMRKKLKLTAEQTNVLEQTFERQNNVDQAQKEELGKRLNLGPRQVEVWFQNRRARAKVQRNGREYELLKESYESLRAENIQLKQEIQDLKSLGGSSGVLQLPSTVVHVVCSSCHNKASRSEDPKSNGHL